VAFGDLGSPAFDNFVIVGSRALAGGTGWRQPDFLIAFAEDAHLLARQQYGFNKVQTI